MERQGARHYFLPARPTHAHRKKKKTRYVVEKTPIEHAVEVKHTKVTRDLEGMYEYIPAADTNEKKKSSRRKKESDRNATSSKGNEWMYVPAASVKESKTRAKKQPSRKSSSKTKVSFAPSAFVLTFPSLPYLQRRRHSQTNPYFNSHDPRTFFHFHQHPHKPYPNITTPIMEEIGTATINDASASEYEHWPDDETQLSGPSAVSGYDGLNGVREFQYMPANTEKKEKKPAEPPKIVKPVPQYYYHPAAAAFQTPQAPLPPQAPQPYAQYMNPYAYPAPAYYGFPGAMPAMAYGQYPPVYVPAPATAPPAAEKKEAESKAKEKEEKKKPEVRRWQGRSKAEVEEDNMKIAKAEGACEARKVEPVGLKADQMVWVVEGDGSPTLRAYATVKEFKGEWKADPRFENSWYFVREQEEEKKCSC